jgi:CBS domain-containing protein
MIPLDSYPSVRQDATLEEAIRVITGAQIERRGRLSLPRVLLVTDDDNRLVGLLRRRDIMRGLLPRFLTEPGDPHPEKHFDLPRGLDLQLVDLLKDEEHKVLTRNAAQPVAAVMHPFEDSIDVEADLTDLFGKMALNEYHFLPVTEDGHVVGVVRTVEILNQIRRLLAS